MSLNKNWQVWIVSSDYILSRLWKILFISYWSIFREKILGMKKMMKMMMKIMRIMKMMIMKDPAKRWRGLAMVDLSFMKQVYF